MFGVDGARIYVLWVLPGDGLRLSSRWEANKEHMGKSQVKYFCVACISRTFLLPFCKGKSLNRQQTRGMAVVRIVKLLFFSSLI